ncbi:hypothetical protein [Streptomyces sp. NBC_00239]|uniref:hypothetical protein n=1 Tax=Streptomyces sp. NBC_00239 TaxID=2903640 RepID=UPI002E2B2CA7|nr:hypothetical protein [Streptomyces sp. NBC_00239]
MTVDPPDGQGRRRVHAGGTTLGRATGHADILEFFRSARLDPDDVHLDDALLIEWRGSGPDAWSTDAGRK